MVHRFVSTIRHLGGGSPFEIYLKSVQRTRRSGIPTFDEARKDYTSAKWSEVIFGA